MHPSEVRQFAALVGGTFMYPESDPFMYRSMSESCFFWRDHEWRS